MTIVITRPKQIHSLSAQSTTPFNNEPYYFKLAIKYASWHDSIHVEYQALLKNNIWELVPPVIGHNVIGCKWVYHLKYRVDCTMACHKARLVAKGIILEKGVDYDETFSPFVKPTTIHTILVVALS